MAVHTHLARHEHLHWHCHCCCPSVHHIVLVFGLRCRKVDSRLLIRSAYPNSNPLSENRGAFCRRARLLVYLHDSRSSPQFSVADCYLLRDLFPSTREECNIWCALRFAFCRRYRWSKRVYLSQRHQDMKIQSHDMKR